MTRSERKQNRGVCAVFGVGKMDGSPGGGVDERANWRNGKKKRVGGGGLDYGGARWSSSCQPIPVAFLRTVEAAGRLSVAHCKHCLGSMGQVLRDCVWEGREAAGMCRPRNQERELRG